MKPGYKQTEVGVIPEEWGNTSLCELVDQTRKITYGIVVPGPAIYDGVPLIRAQDYSKGWVDLEDLYRVSHTVDKAYKRSKVITGDVLLTIVGSVGNIAKVPQTFDGSNITQQTARLSFNPEVADADYYLNVLMSDVGRKAIANFTKSGVQPSLNLSDVEKFILPHPPLPEQRAIATALSDVDGLLGGLDRLIAKKRDLKQAAMQQLLTGQTRLPGFHGEWEETTLGQIGECIIGLTYKPENVVEHGLLVLRSSNVQSGRLAYDNNVHVNLQVAEHLYTQIGDILVCVRNGSRALIGKCAVINSSAVGVTFGAFMSVYRTKHWRFVLHAFQGDDIQRQIRDNIGATINQITNKDMKAFCLRLPPEDEQTAIAEVLTEMDAELAGLTQRREKTRALKQAMMQELLTGRIRLVASSGATE